MTKGEADRAGKRLAANLTDTIALDAVAAWRASHWLPLGIFRAQIGDPVRAIFSNAIIVNRLKRIESIRAKLTRMSTRLSQMQDIAGCRVIAMTGFLRPLVAELRDIPNFTCESVVEKLDDTGYRGVHMVFRYTGPAVLCRGLQLELQIRSGMQHVWATAVETVGIFTRQNLKAGLGDPKWLRFFALASSLMHQDDRRTPATPESLIELLDETESLSKELRVAERLDAYRVVESLNDSVGFNGLNPEAEYYLLCLDLDSVKLDVSAFTKGEREKANDAIVAVEQEIAKGRRADAVLVSATDVADLREAYPNYFALTDSFAKWVREARAAAKLT